MSNYKKNLMILSLMAVVFTKGCTMTDKGVGKCTDWRPLFDGKTLNGWHALPGGDWTVTDGAIVGISPKAEKRHGILLSNKRYEDFVLRLKFKALSGNSGLYFRVDKVKGAVSVNGFQAEIDPVKKVGGLYETGGRAWVVEPGQQEVKKYFRPGQWNEMKVSAQGRDITVYVNGYKTAKLTDDPGRLEGHIGLQLHGGMDMLVMFRDIEICIP